MTQPESRLSRKIMDALRAEGWFCFKVWGSDHTMAGLPDLVVCAEGLFVGLETKMPAARGHTSPRQDRVHGLIRDAGGVAQVVCGPAEAVRAVKSAISRRDRIDENDEGALPKVPGESRHDRDA